MRTRQIIITVNETVFHEVVNMLNTELNAFNTDEVIRVETP